MKHLLHAAFIILGITLMNSCNQSGKENLSLNTDFQIVKINNDYEMKIPNYMTETKELNDLAKLQYMNGIKETYVVVMDEPKDDFINTFKSLNMYNDSLSVILNYCEVQLKNMTKAIKNQSVFNRKSSIINGLNSESVNIEGNIDDAKEKISYVFTFIEGKDKIYSIMAWTLKDRMDTYSDTYKKISESFRLIH